MNVQGLKTRFNESIGAKNIFYLSFMMCNGKFDDSVEFRVEGRGTRYETLELSAVVSVEI